MWCTGNPAVEKQFLSEQLLSKRDLSSLLLERNPRTECWLDAQHPSKAPGLETVQAANLCKIQPHSAKPIEQPRQHNRPKNLDLPPSGNLRVLPHLRKLAEVGPGGSKLLR